MWFVVDGGVPFSGSEAVPVTDCCVCDSVSDVSGVFFDLDGGVVVGAGYPCRVVEDDSGVGCFLTYQSVVVEGLTIESKTVVVGFVFEFDTCLVAEVLPGCDNAGAVAEDVVDIVRPLVAKVAGVGVVGGTSWWNVEGFAASYVSGK